MENIKIRDATPADLDAINAIYNHYVFNSTCTYQDAPATAAERRAWFDAHGPRHPVTVAVSGSEIIGWASLSKFHQRAAYSNTVENSVYLRHDVLGRGIGGMLLADIIERAAKIGHHTIIAGISSDQIASVKLHRKQGFVEVALLREVGYKFDRWLDVVYMQRMLKPQPSPVSSV